MDDYLRNHRFLILFDRELYKYLYRLKCARRLFTALRECICFYSLEESLFAKQRFQKVCCILWCRCALHNGRHYYLESTYSCDSKPQLTPRISHKVFSGVFVCLLYRNLVGMLLNKTSLKT